MKLPLQIYQIMTDYLLKRGVTMTGKRKIILKAVAQRLVIEDIDEFWIDIRNESRISWATVRVFITQLYELGLLEKQKIGTRGIKYILAKPLRDFKP